MQLFEFLKLNASTGKWRNTAVSHVDPMPVTSGGGNVAVDASGTITTGGAAQNVFAANTSRREFTFVNNSDTLMMLRIGGTASATAGIPVYPGDIVNGEETNAVSVFCATTGKAFTAWDR